jgi:hypothetical protein
MKSIRALLSVTALVLPLAIPVLAVAQSAPPIISCGQARSMVMSNGAAVVRSSATIYDRYVSDIRFCARGETTKAAFIATIDNGYCPVGFRCVEPNNSRNQE